MKLTLEQKTKVKKFANMLIETGTNKRSIINGILNLSILDQAEIFQEIANKYMSFSKEEDNENYKQLAIHIQKSSDILKNKI